MSFEDSELTYRSPIIMKTETPASSVDEQEFSTLLVVRNQLAEDIGRLDGIHAFKLTGTQEERDAYMAGAKIAYDILAPIYDTLDSTISAINNKYRRM